MNNIKISDCPYCGYEMTVLEVGNVEDGTYDVLFYCEICNEEFLLRDLPNY